MKLLLKRNLSDEFVRYLIRQYILYISSIIDFKKLNPINKYLKENLFKDKFYKKNINALNIIVIGVYSIKYRKNKYKTVLYIDPYKKLPHTDIKLVSLCKLINYGNMDIKGYPIFTRGFNYIKENIDELYDRYLDQL